MIDTWEKVLDPNFINAELIGEPGAERVVTIKDIDFEEAFDQKTNSKIKKQSIFFEECKPMILNKTNTKTLIKLFGGNGSQPKDCVGKKIILYVVRLSVAGRETTGIRIKEYTSVKCENCGRDIEPTRTKTVADLVAYSKKNTGKTLCLECMKEIANKAKEDANNG